MLRFLAIAVCLVSAVASDLAIAQERSIVVASTTSIEDSGLFDYMLPLFTEKTGIAVRVIAEGTGRALDTGRSGRADVLFVHDKPEELKFLAEGWGIKRFDVMHNDFVLLGPKSDPANVVGLKDIVVALKTIGEKGATFVSRGDRSGTQVAELKLWKLASLDPGETRPSWYRETNQGMSATLKMASDLGGYVLSDRGTWLESKTKIDLVVAVEGDDRLFNQYGVILVNPARLPNIKASLGEQFIDWLISPQGQGVIASYKVNGEQLFYPDRQH